MTIIKRGVKGSPLTHEELDANFQHFLDLPIDVPAAPDALMADASTRLIGHTGSALAKYSLAQILAAFGAANVVYTNTALVLTRAAHASKIIVTDTSAGAITHQLAKNVTSGFQLYDTLPMIIKVGSTPANQVTLSLTGDTVAWANDTGMLKATTSNCPVLGFIQGENDKWTPTMQSAAGSTGITSYYSANALTFTPADTTEQDIAGSSVSIPYSAIGPNGKIEVHAIAQRSTGVGSLTMKARVTGVTGGVTADVGSAAGANSALIGGVQFSNTGASATNLSHNFGAAGASVGTPIVTTVETSGGITVHLRGTESATPTTHFVRKFFVVATYGA